MINHADIENVIGCKTLVTDRMQQAIEGWYDAAINGLPMNHNPETLTLGLPSLICSELARLTTLELEVKVEGSPRADWINTQLQRVISPRKRRILAVALALGSGWQNIPEGAAVSLPLVQAGQGRRKAFCAGAASGLVEPLGALLALALAGWVSAALPWLMSAAAGCWVCVTAQKKKPDAVEQDEPAGVISVVLGFALMMALDIAL